MMCIWTSVTPQWKTCENQRAMGKNYPSASRHQTKAWTAATQKESISNPSDTKLSHSGYIGKAVRRVTQKLPSSPRKRGRVINELIARYSNIQSPIASTPTAREMSDAEEAVIAFFLREGISRISPTVKDVMVVRPQTWWEVHNW
jgi:hypothetical protein